MTYTLRRRNEWAWLGFWHRSGQNVHMKIQLNGEPRPLCTPFTVTELLAQEGLAERRVAVEVNNEIVPRSQHGSHQLQDGDVVEIVHALGGG